MEFKEIHKFKVGKEVFEPFKKVLIIAEIGSNHDGNLKKAYKLIDVAKSAGCDAVKFQLFTADKLIQRKFKGWKILKKLEIEFEFIKKVKKYAKKKKILFGVSPFDNTSTIFLTKIGIDFFKIASTEIEDLELLKIISKTKKPLIISSGAANLTEISNAINYSRKRLKNLALLHCVSIYPPKISQLNLNMMSSLRNAFHIPVGFSDHSTSYNIPAIAATLGACVIEKHITLNNKSKGPDHPFAMNPSQLKLMVKNIREVEISLGSKVKQPIIKNEKVGVARRIVASKNLKINQKLTIKDLIIKRADPKGVEPKDLEKIINLRLRKKINKDQIIKWQDFK